MSFSIDTYRLPRIRCFQDAEVYYNNTQAIRGQDKSSAGVPLRSDRKNWRTTSLRKLNNGGYALRLYYTDVVVYHSDGSVTLDVSYKSRSTNEFASALLPPSINACTRFDRPVVYIGNNGYGYDYYLGIRPMTFIKNPETNTYALLNPEQLAVTKQVLNRKRAKAVREMLQPLMGFVNTMRAMGPLSEDALVGVPSLIVYSSYVTEEYITNPDNFMMFLRPYYRSASVGGRWGARLQEHTEKAILKEAYRRFDAYDRVPLPQGKIHKTMKYAV